MRQLVNAAGPRSRGHRKRRFLARFFLRSMGKAYAKQGTHGVAAMKKRSEQSAKYCKVNTMKKERGMSKGLMNNRLDIPSNDALPDR